MMDLPELYILRHGETEWNVQGRLQGALDSALTERGRGQAARQGAILAALDLSKFDLLCSPQGRAVETARIALGDRATFLQKENELAEVGIGAWAGISYADLGLDVALLTGPLGSLALYEHAPEGEGLAALECRCFSFLQRLTGPSVLITHGVTSRMLRVLATGQARAEIAKIGGGQGVVYRVKNGVQKRLE